MKPVFKFPYFLRARVELDKTAQPLYATVECVGRSGLSCTWHLNRTQFESLHGLYRLTNIMWDKLAAAIDVHQGGEDGRFFVQLLIQIADFFIDLTASHIALDTTGDVNGSLEFLRGDDSYTAESLSFLETMRHFKGKLKQFHTLLSDLSQSQETLEKEAGALLQLGHDIHFCCLTFLHFIHPLWNDTSRHLRRSTPKLVEDCSNSLDRLLEKVGEKMSASIA